MKTQTGVKAGNGCCDRDPKKCDGGLNISVAICVDLSLCR